MGYIGNKWQPELKGNYADTSEHKVKKDNKWKRIKK